MANLLIIRHGQASFGADNYDQLSPLGQRQADATMAILAASFRSMRVAVHNAKLWQFSADSADRACGTSSVSLVWTGSATPAFLRHRTLLTFSSLLFTCHVFD